MEKQKFLILAHPRTGSNYLVHLLDSHPGISASNEVFNLHQHPEKVIKDPKACLLELFNDPSRRHYQLTGCKILYGQLTPDDLIFVRNFDQINLGFLERTRLVNEMILKEGPQIVFQKFTDFWNFIGDSKDIAIVHLKRRNYFHTFISLFQALRTDIWRIENSNSSPGQNDRITIKPERCEEFFQAISSGETYYDEFFQGHHLLELFYEDLCSDTDKILKEIQLFFRLPAYAFRSKTIKQNLQPYSLLVSNYAALKDHFRSTIWEDFFGEDK